MLLNGARVESLLLLGSLVQVHLLEELVRLLQGLVLLFQDLAIVLHVIKPLLQQSNLSIHSLLVHVGLHQLILQVIDFDRVIALTDIKKVHVNQIQTSHQIG